MSAEMAADLRDDDCIPLGMAAGPAQTAPDVFGQDLGITLDMETFNIRAHAKGIRQSTDLVVMAAAEDGGSGGVTLTLLHHPTGGQFQRRCDWVVCAAHQAPDDQLWHELAGAAFTVERVGDCLAPRRAHAAVLEGHRAGAAV